MAKLESVKENALSNTIHSLIFCICGKEWVGVENWVLVALLLVEKLAKFAFYCLEQLTVFPVFPWVLLFPFQNGFPLTPVQKPFLLPWQSASLSEGEEILFIYWSFHAFVFCDFVCYRAMFVFAFLCLQLFHLPVVLHLMSKHMYSGLQCIGKNVNNKTLTLKRSHILFIFL